MQTLDVYVSHVPKSTLLVKMKLRLFKKKKAIVMEILKSIQSDGSQSNNSVPFYTVNRRWITRSGESRKPSQNVWGKKDLECETGQVWPLSRIQSTTSSTAHLNLSSFSDKKMTQLFFRLLFSYIDWCPTFHHWGPGFFFKSGIMVGLKGRAT